MTYLEFLKEFQKSGNVHIHSFIEESIKFFEYSEGKPKETEEKVEEDT